MDNGFSVLMLIFGGALLLYAAALSSGNENLLPYRVQPTLRKTGRKAQVRHIAAVTALVSLPILFGGIAGWIWNNTVCLITMGVSAALLIAWSVIRHRSNAEKKRDDSDE